MARERDARHVLVLGDQLTAAVGPLAEAEPADTTVVLIESVAWARRRRYHRAKLALVFSAMRHLAGELRVRGFDVAEYRVDAFEDGLAEHLARHPGARIELMAPAEHRLADHLALATEERGGSLRIVPNGLWLSSDEDFDAWAAARRSLRLEHWYRRERRRTSWLMSADGTPAGGVWNLDAQNRQRVPDGATFRSPPAFGPDAVTREVIAWVEQTFADHPGELGSFGWPVTRTEAQVMLDDFVEHRLRDFGPYQDAMVDGQRVLAHSQLSVPLNLGLITAGEACEAALAAYADEERRADPQRAIPLASVEGFIRQLLGWREFLRHAYRTRMPGLAEANALGHEAPLPSLYWTGETAMRCMGEAVRGVLETGHAHHIQRLMILGNWALLAGVDPRAVDHWFQSLFVDAFEWVVTPNVMGMSQWADQAFTSKPYVAGGAYIDRMSDHCGRCPYDPRRKVGPGACPFSSLYWDFVDRHAERLRGNPRMGNAVRTWLRLSPRERAAVTGQAREVRASAAEGRL